MFDLNRIQQWFQAVITHPDGAAAGVLGPDARNQIDVTPDELATILTRSQTLTAAERIAIYSRAYHLRLTECLEAEFPVLRLALGDELFRMFAHDYLSGFPSHSYTLAELAKDFPVYLQDTRPVEGPDGEEEQWPDFIIDLARFERASNEVFDGPGAEGKQRFSAQEVQRVLANSGARTRLTPVVCLRLLRFRYPVHDYFHAVRMDERPEWPLPGETFLAMNRRDYVVRILELSEAQHALLSGLLAGQTVRQSLQRAGASSPDQQSQLVGSLEQWSEQGFFSTMASCA